MTFRFRWAYALCLAALAGCAQHFSSSPLPAQAAATAGASTTFRTLYSFKGGSDGAGPAAGLTILNGNLYGTTAQGGRSGCEDVYTSCGVVYRIVPSTGVEKVLHIFGAGYDGQNPFAGLLVDSGTLYGTTNSGGPGGAGTFFSVTPNGSERVVYPFGQFNADGLYPKGAVVVSNGVFYGTTTEGGAFNGGTVFAVTRSSGKERVLYNFRGGSDGANPAAGLTVVSGVLYGTTLIGGAGGQGTIFKLTTSGAETILYSFTLAGKKDGRNPVAGLTYAGGSLYGTAKFGGSKAKGGVFKYNMSSKKEQLLYSFAGKPDGAFPKAGLIFTNDFLYGTTASGGTTNDGAVFRISTSGKERILYSFTGGSDGGTPLANLVAFKGTLYGTTSSGGINSYCYPSISSEIGCGTVFAITP